MYINRFIPVLQTKNGHATENISGYNLRFIVSHGVITFLKPAAFSERDNLHAANHQVIQQTDIHQVQGLSEPLCYLTVRQAGIGKPRRMTMRHNDSGGVMFQTGFHHFAGMDLSMVDSAAEERFVSNKAMLVIEEERNKSPYKRTESLSMREYVSIPHNRAIHI